MTQPITKERVLQAAAVCYAFDSEPRPEDAEVFYSMLDRYARSVVEAALGEPWVINQDPAGAPLPPLKVERLLGWNDCRQATLDNLNKQFS